MESENKFNLMFDTLAHKVSSSYLYNYKSKEFKRDVLNYLLNRYNIPEDIGLGLFNDAKLMCNEPLDILELVDYMASDKDITQDSKKIIKGISPLTDEINIKIHLDSVNYTDDDFKSDVVAYLSYVYDLEEPVSIVMFNKANIDSASRKSVLDTAENLAQEQNTKNIMSGIDTTYEID